MTTYCCCDLFFSLWFSELYAGRDYDSWNVVNVQLEYVENSLDAWLNELKFDVEATTMGLLKSVTWQKDSELN